MNRLLIKKPNHLRPYLKQYAKDQGIDLRSAVADTLADLMHICREEDLDYDERYNAARNHYVEERANLIQTAPKKDLAKLSALDLNRIERRELALRLSEKEASNVTLSNHFNR